MMKRTLLLVALFVLLLSGCKDLNDMMDMRGPYYMAEGWEQISSGYKKKYDHINIEMEGGIRYSLSDHLEKGFFIGHNSDREMPLNVEGAVLEGNGKKYEGKIVSTVFSEASKFGPNQRGYVKIRWDFGDEGDIEVYGDNFDITFNVKLDGRPETIVAHFELPAAYIDPGKTPK
jgi:hypothetical protein